MIWSALRSKLRERGAIGFAADAGELAIACGVIAAWSLALGAAAVVGGVVAAPLMAVDLLTSRRPGEPTSCRNTEERTP